MARRIGTRILTKKVLKFEGIPQIVENANKLIRATGGNTGGQVARELKQAFMVGALIVRDEIRDLVPVRTGLLKSSVFAAYGDETKADVLVGVNTHKAVKTSRKGQTRTYAGVVEFGNAHQQPHPYARPGIQAARPTAARVMKEALVTAVEKLAVRLGMKPT
jgi:HK97 gp10 family phage protein